LLHPKILIPRELFDNLKDLHYMMNNKKQLVVLEPNQFNNLIDSNKEQTCKYILQKL